MVAAILNLKKCTRGIFGASSEFVWGDVQVSFLKKSAFCNFIPGSCVFFTNALALKVYRSFTVLGQNKLCLVYFLLKFTDRPSGQLAAGGVNRHTV